MTLTEYIQRLLDEDEVLDAYVSGQTLHVDLKSSNTCVNHIERVLYGVCEGLQTYDIKVTYHD